MTDDDETFANLPLTQSLTWWVATELIRRHPDELLCHHISSPMGPPYLQVFVSGELGRAIELPLYPRDSYITVGGRSVGLAEILHSYDRRERFVVPIEESLGLERVSDLAPTSSKTIGFRVMAAFLSRSLLGPGWWVARPVVEFNGDIDGPALHLDDLKRFGLDPDQFNGRLHHLWALAEPSPHRAVLSTASSKTAPSLPTARSTRRSPVIAMSTK